MKLRSFWMFAAATVQALSCNSATLSTTPAARGGAGAWGTASGPSATDARIDVYANCGKPMLAIAPAVPDVLRPPAGSILVGHFRGEGSQIYTCKAPGAAGAYAWTLKAPDAKLFGDDGCGPIASHFAGPTWQSDADGSTVLAVKVASATSPLTNAIPWLLLKTTMTAGQGIFRDVTAVQRLETVGGVAPAAGCDATAVDRQTSVPYSAIYNFYREGQWDGSSHDAATVAALVAASTGKWTVYPDPYTNGQANPAVGIQGNAVAVRRGSRGMSVLLTVYGLPPNRSFGAHLHKLACNEMSAGGHYQQIPAPGGANPSNEVWLDFTPFANGVGIAQADQQWIPRVGEAKSIVVHDHGTVDGGVAGAKLACLAIKF